MTHTVPGAEIPRLREERPDELHIFPYLGTYYYIFNCEQEPFDDVRVRRALTMAIDRKALVEEVTQGGEMPAYAFVPPGVADVEEGSDFREVGGDFFEEDIEKAKQLLAEAGYEDGEGFPAFEILYNTHEMHKIIAEAIMEMWEKNLGITGITLRNEEWGVYLTSRDEGDFDVARAGWIGDYVEPNTFLDMWKTGSGNNNTNWGDPRYDEIISELVTLADPADRMPLMHEQEEILMRDMPIMPIYYYTSPMMVSSNLKGYLYLTTGGLDFKTAYLEE
jgi:oligopeptide transport system substrate-binding protein